MRNQVVFLMLCFFIPSILFAEISVKSFAKQETDMTAKIDAPIIDQNGDVCALIKVVTTQTGFNFDCGQLGIMKTVQKPAEIWIYVPYGTKKMTITHAQLGKLSNYFFNQPIEKATVYEMVLTSGRVETTVVEEISSQWLVIRPQPDNALIYIDDNFVKTGEYQGKLKPGSYTYRVEALMYHPEAGRVEVSDAKKELNVTLKPAFGYIDFASSPEAGAIVSIDGKQQGKVTPFVSEPLASGEHTVQVVKDMFQPVVKKITVTDGQTTPVNFILSPNFAEVSITAPADATLYVNNQQKGIGTWQGRLNAGVYSLEARKDKHRPAKLDIEVVATDKRVVDLQPTPIYGSLDVMTTPSGATITLNKKEYGTTPNTMNKLLIGDYTLKLSKTGYATVNKTVTVTEGKSIELNEILTNGKA
ncbi:MAG: PEGA domain-containing protein, partial [Bacteroidia bacterium]|nr:PEGA domain-containing protein [Bacteroidia bacterium]